MADYSIDTKSMTSKVISLVVAIVVFACVLVPVVGSMEDGGDSGSESIVTVTNEGQKYALANRDNAVHTMVLSNDNDEIKVVVDGEVLDTLNVTESTTLCLGYYQGYWLSIATGGWEKAKVSYTWQRDTPDYPSGMENNYQLGTLMEDGDTVSIAIQNGEMSVTTLSGNEYTLPLTMYYSNTADYVYCTDHAKAPLDATIYLGHPDVVVVNGRGDGWTVVPAQGKLVEILADSKAIMLYGMAEDGEVTSPTVDLDTNSQYSTINSYSFTLNLFGENDVVVPTQYHPGVYVPASFTYTEESGGDSDSDSGMVGTLIGIIPVFVALGLILAIVGMFYNPNRMD